MNAPATLNEIVIRINQLSREAKNQLEVEESGRKVAELQGNIAGYRKFLNFLCAEFHLTQQFIEESGDKELNLAETSDTQLDIYSSEIHWLQNDSHEWKEVLARIQETDDGLKDWLLYKATKSRDLDVAQGTHQAMIMYDKFFEAIFSEVERRKKKAEEERDKERDEGMQLPFNEAAS